MAKTKKVYLYDEMDKDIQDNILDDFAMESPFCPETLRSYLKKYPELALELTDLYHELLMVELTMDYLPKDRG